MVKRATQRTAVHRKAPSVDEGASASSVGANVGRSGDDVGAGRKGLITPAQLAAGGSEHDHQVAVMQWVAIEGRAKFEALRWLHAIPNGGGRTMSVAASMKAEGVKRGVPDLCLPYPVAGYHGLYLELKTPKAYAMKNHNLSEYQLEWVDYLAEQGYAIAVAGGWQAAVWVLHLYMSWQFPMTLDRKFLKADPTNFVPEMK